MRLAIMQPYFFPYFGYWQLMAAADRFVVYDDVQYIKGGWINHNKIKINERAAYISLRLENASPNKRICDIHLSPGMQWKERLLRMMSQAYARTPFLKETLPLIRAVVLCPESNLADYLLNGLMQVRDHLDIRTTIVPTSRSYKNEDLAGAKRVLDICRREGATTYINAQGGRALYSSAEFDAFRIDLSFLVMRQLVYPQGKFPFVSNLSVIDVLAWVGREKARALLSDFDIEPAR